MVILGGMFLPWLLLSCSLSGPSTPAPESPAARAAEEIAQVAIAVEELAAEAAKIALLTDKLRDSTTASATDRQELAEQAKRARNHSETAQTALNRATHILAEATP